MPASPGPDSPGPPNFPAPNLSQKPGASLVPRRVSDARADTGAFRLAGPPCRAQRPGLGAGNVALPRGGGAGRGAGPAAQTCPGPRLPGLAYSPPPFATTRRLDSRSSPRSPAAGGAVQAAVTLRPFPAPSYNCMGRYPTPPSRPPGQASLGVSFSLTLGPRAWRSLRGEPCLEFPGSLGSAFAKPKTKPQTLASGKEELGNRGALVQGCENRNQGARREAEGKHLLPKAAEGQLWFLSFSLWGWGMTAVSSA